MAEGKRNWCGKGGVPCSEEAIAEFDTWSLVPSLLEESRQQNRTMSREQAPRNQTSLRLEIAQEGDLRAYVQLVQPLLDRLFAYAFLMTGSIQDAEDCVQRGLKSARDKLTDIGSLSVERFVLRHVRREVLSLIMARPYSPPPAVPAGPNAPTIETALRVGDSDSLGAIALPLLQGLPTEERDTFLLAVLLGLGTEGVHAVTEVEPAVSAARLKRALRDLEESGRVYSSATSNA